MSSWLAFEPLETFFLLPGVGGGGGIVLENELVKWQLEQIQKVSLQSILA